MEGRNSKIVCIFDVDGTHFYRTKKCKKNIKNKKKIKINFYQVVTQDMIDTLALLKKKCIIAAVSGSDMSKLVE